MPLRPDIDILLALGLKNGPSVVAAGVCPPGARCVHDPYEWGLVLVFVYTL